MKQSSRPRLVQINELQKEESILTTQGSSFASGVTDGLSKSSTKALGVSTQSNGSSNASGGGFIHEASVSSPQPSNMKNTAKKGMISMSTHASPLAADKPPQGVSGFVAGLEESERTSMKTESDSSDDEDHLDILLQDQDYYERMDAGAVQARRELALASTPSSMTGRSGGVVNRSPRTPQVTPILQGGPANSKKRTPAGVKIVETSNIPQPGTQHFGSSPLGHLEISEDLSPAANRAVEAISLHHRMKKLQENMAHEIEAYVPGYEAKKKKLEDKLRDQQQGKRVDFEGDEVWEQKHRWYQNPAYAPTAGWHPAEMKPGALIEQANSLKLERLKTPADRRRVEGASTQAKKNTEVIREATSEISLTPFRNLVFFDGATRKQRSAGKEDNNNLLGGSRGAGGSRAGRRANTSSGYYPPNPFEVENMQVEYKVPKCLLSQEESSRLGLLPQSRQSTRSKTPLNTGTVSHNNTTSKSRSSTLNRTLGGVDGSSGSPMKFALPAMLDRRMPTPQAYKHATQLKKKGKSHKCRPNCPHCDNVAQDINHFEAEEFHREELHQREVENAQRKSSGEASHGDDGSGIDRRQSGALPGSEGDALEGSKLLRRVPSNRTAKAVVHAADKIVNNMLKARKEAKLAEEPLQPQNVTINHLYFDMSHRDREDVYISVVGGLSFDLTREKFASLMTHVLAPRIGITLTDEQIHTMFSIFDINHGGTISYFEYLAALCHSLLTEEQTNFLTGVFNMCIQSRQQAALQREIHKRNAGDLAAIVGGSAGPQAAMQASFNAPTLHSSVAGSGAKLVRKASLTSGTFRKSMRESSPSSPAGSPKKGGVRKASFDAVSDDESPVTSPQRRKSMRAGMEKSTLSDDEWDESPSPQRQREKPTTFERENSANAKLSTLRKKHLKYEKVRNMVFNYRGLSLMFPHPVEDRFSQLLADCFDELRESDELDFAKFKLLLFCDDAVVEALHEIFPSPIPQGLAHLLVEPNDSAPMSPNSSFRRKSSLAKITRSNSGGQMKAKK